MKPRKAQRKRRVEGLHVAEPAPPPYEHASAVARVFQSGNSQAVRLPKRFRLRGPTVQVFRRGGDIVLREKPMTLSAALRSLPPLPDDALPDEIPDRPPEPVEEP